MHDIIQQIQKDLYCPICGKNYEVGEIRLKGLFDHTLIIHTICENGHQTIFMTKFIKKEENKSLNSDDVLDLHDALANFNGDFEKIWKTS